MFTSEAITRGVRVQVTSRHDPERSDPAQGHWFFLYTVAIANESLEAVQLVSRHWVITDGEGAIQEVRGPGVVGEQPVLRPGQSFEYASFCPLPTAVGTMHGEYEMRTPAGEVFEAAIAPFSLAVPHALN